MKKYFLLIVCIVLYFNFSFGETIEFSAGFMSGKAGKSNTTTILEENAFIKTETMEIYADYIELSGEDFRYIKARGNVDGKNFQNKMDFSCDTLEYDRKEERAVLKGNVVFIDLENEVEAKAEVIDYDQKNEIAILQINVNLKQEDNVSIGSYCIYYKEKQILEISGNAQVQQKDDVFRAQHITLNLETEEISLGGNVKGTVKDSKEENNNIEEYAENSTDNKIQDKKIENKKEEDKNKISDKNEKSEMDEKK